MCVTYVDEGRVIFLLRQDYVGEDVNAENFFNVILANKSGITGGSGKVLNSGQNGHIFIYYTEQDGLGIIFNCLLYRYQFRSSHIYKRHNT